MIALAALALGLSSCAMTGGSKKSEDTAVEKEVIQPWDLGGRGKGNFDRVIPFSTTLAQLHNLGIDPQLSNSVHRIDQAQIRAYFDYDPRTRSEQPDGILTCVDAGDRCYGYILQEPLVERHVKKGLLRKKVESEFHVPKYEAVILIMREPVLDESVVTYTRWNDSPPPPPVSFQKPPPPVYFQGQ
ncbi:hypothetical protein [Magnetofaba australis]|uniref:Lipoprotein n=1 Tax=Magnetofaba australis IT-1 TaxID=1434232 RepID=A0A1Y2K1I3_9PROT|nr:hypothetical protein [Magnetofaba australis]OSM01537.1 hypothetical protein MAIT1_01532 [Magnetofaba australis IT-1]